MRTPAEQREKGEEYARQRYLNGIAKPCKKAPDSLDNEYRRLVANKADSFFEVDKYIILAAIRSLPENERLFIQSADKEIYPANAFIDLYQEKSRFVPPRHFLEKTDIFAVKLYREERIYALKSGKEMNDGYKIIRVDRDVKRYVTNGLFGDALTGYKINWDNDYELSHLLKLKSMLIVLPGRVVENLAV
ncbi:hypothetical protein [Izhakiella capsodis]|uniref:hypothetical protein n=1 Tax=Izhakiella capsodis TaxID=1367852 RepID=UPI000B82FB5F|nr:hypothetical protein [Izhakiella capsodis]